jgi:hypothetical protein
MPTPKFLFYSKLNLRDEDVHNLRFTETAKNVAICSGNYDGDS